MTSVGVEAMSAREAEVLGALGQHLTNAEIARQLHISVRTVESHVSSLLRKLDAADRHELASLAAQVEARPTPASAEIVGLPGTWTSFVGRMAELDGVARAVAAGRLVTLVGPGGIGKTRLATVAAQQSADGFPAGGAFVNLVPVSDGFVVQAVAAALHVVARPQEPLEIVVHERLRQGRSLLVLDNCEHVLAAVARFTESVLAACPEAVVLATSRERLGVSGEQVVPVPPLGLAAPGTASEAELLFLERAASAAGLGSDPTLVAELCRRLDGVPLAIELAAARSGSLGVDGLIAGLDDRLRLLSRSGTADDRHGSLRTVIEWSHQLLDDDERTLFRRLSVFAGDIDLPAATEVAADGDVALASDVIGRLTDKSLLSLGRGPTGSRWRMLDTVHAFAAEQLAASGELDDLRGRHLTWAAATAAEIEATLDGDTSWQDRFDAVADDLRAALSAALGGDGTPRARPDGADDPTAFTLASALGHLAYSRRFLVEARDHYRSAVALAGDEATAVATLRLTADAAFAEMRGDIAFQLLTTAYERALAAGDRCTAAIALADASAIAGRAPATFLDAPGHDRLVGLVEQARALAPEDDPEVAVHVALAAAWDGARAPCTPAPGVAEEALVLARRLGDPVLISSALDAVAASATFERRYKDASRLSFERMGLLDQLARHDPRVGGEIADIFHMASEAAMAAGELDASLAAARLASDDSVGQGMAHFAAAHHIPPLVLQGGFDEALVQAVVMHDGWQRSGSPAAGWMAPAAFAAALAHGLRGDEAAYAHWWGLAAAICLQTRPNSFSLFVHPRVALHLGHLDEAYASAAAEGVDTAGAYDAYAVSMRVEVAVVAGEADAGAQLERARALAPENDFAAAQLTRAAGRLHEDEATLEAAVVQWDAIGARFERACTLLLLPDRAAEGQHELEAMRIPAPQPAR